MIALLAAQLPPTARVRFATALRELEGDRPRAEREAELERRSQSGAVTDQRTRALGLMISRCKWRRWPEMHAPI